MKSIFAALAAIAVSVVSAQNIISSQPSTNQVLTAGTTAQIVWAPVDGTISTIDLRSGSASALTFLQNVASNIPASAGTYAWNVPATLAAGTDYALSFGQSPNVTYTPFFTVKAASGGAASSTAPASSGAATSSAAVSSAAKPSAAASSAASSAAKPSAAASSAASASSSAGAKPTTTTSGANKNAAAVGAIAVVGAVAAALI